MTEARSKPLRRIARPAAYAFYAVFVFEILFMISPFALYFYSVYGPTLNGLQHWTGTAWLTEFFLPHVSRTRDPLLNALPALGGALTLAGVLVFLAAALPLYWAKLRRRGAVTGGLYRSIRHPQYLGLAITGLGTLLLWPRFLPLVAYITMFFVYRWLARWEEAQCLARFGESYRLYQARTGMFLPRRWPGWLRLRLPAARWAAPAAYVLSLGAGLAAAHGLQAYSLSQVSARFTDDVAVLSPALLSERELMRAYAIALADPRVQDALRPLGRAKLIVHVVPQEWDLPDLALASAPDGRGHHTPAAFDRHRYTVLFSRIRTHAAAPVGRGIVTTAYGRDPIILARVDIESGTTSGVETPPPLYWGDIPTPLF